MIRMRYFFLLIILYLPFFSFSQSDNIRVEPPSWWTGFVHHNLQLLVYAENVGETNVIIHYPGIKVQAVHKAESPDYLFIDLLISPETKSGTFPVIFEKNREIVYSYEYHLYERSEGSKSRKGFDNSDVIYLLMPDRFANGNPGNDSVPGMLEGVDRKNPGGRHGGDIQGIIDHLDYIKDLGMTAIWSTPLLENNMPKYSYHGYSITDYYRIDPRYGSNELYGEMVGKAHSKGLKVIMDMVFNHCGSRNWWMNDLPFSDWIHQFPDFTRSNYRSESIMDPHGSDYDRDLMLTGWFDRTMPDLNQHNVYMGKYLIQNSIWWIEFAGLDGIRMDTYPYAYKDFMASWDEYVMEEYPNFNIVGEAWQQTEPQTAYFAGQADNRDGFDSHLPTVTDFPFYFAIRDAFNEKDDWTHGIAKPYYVLSEDFLYSNPMNTMVFADNHDLTRYFSSVGEDLNKWKMGMTFVLTSRGIPLIYYGTEFLMTGIKEKGDGYIRQDFPCGWPGDSLDLVDGVGRTAEQEQGYNFLTTLLHYRDKNPVLQTGALKQFAPLDGVYAYFRYNSDKTIMVVFNNNPTEEKQLKMDKFTECLLGRSRGRNIISGEEINLVDSLLLPPKSVMIIDVME